MTTCIPVAQGVFNLPGPPNWWDTSAGAPPKRDTLDDPRWTGAATEDFGSGTTVDAEFRALYAKDWLGVTSLFLSWTVLYDSALDDGLDKLYVGFVPTGLDPLLIEVIAYNSSAADITDGTPGSIQAYSRDPGTGVGIALSKIPAWLDTTRVWLTRTPITWAIEMRVPINPAATSLTDDNGVNLNVPGTFSMFYEIYVKQSGTGPAAYTWPVGVASVQTVLAGDIYPDPATWDQFHLSTGAGDPLCPTSGGIALQILDIGSTNTPDSLIEYSDNPPFPVNTILASPRNETANPIPAGGITARFRIADWGSSIYDPNAPWDDIRGGSAVSNAVAIPPFGTAPFPPPSPYISFQWQLNAAERAPYEDPINPKNPDQCLLVDLQGPGLTFLDNSVRRNMDVEKASSLVRNAKVSIERLTPLPGSVQRDVYLALETRNMPTTVEPNGGNGGGTPAAGQRESPGQAPGEANKALEAIRQAGLARAVSGGQLTTNQIATFAPTYIVHVFHDTGEKIRMNGVTYPILAPQSSFGYFVEHEGKNDVWAPRLWGAIRITDVMYVLRVPNQGAAQVITTVHAGPPGQTVPPEPPIVPFPPTFGDEFRTLIALLHQISEQIEALLTAPPGPENDLELRLRIMVLGLILTQIEALLLTPPTPLLRPLFAGILDLLQGLTREITTLLAPPQRPASRTALQVIVQSLARVLAALDAVIDRL